VTLAIFVAAEFVPAAGLKFPRLQPSQEQKNGSMTQPKKSSTGLALMLAACLGCLALPTGAYAQGSSAGTGNSAAASSAGDKTFITDAAESDITEITMAKLAMKNSQNADVKKYAQMMVNDHTKSTTELKPIAQKHGVTPPSAPMVETHKQMAAALEKLSGPAFDNAYLDSNVKAHKETIDKLGSDMGKVTDADLKAFGQKMMPVIKHHYEMAVEMQGKMSKKS
jgi:putative membrane protein